MVTRRLLLGGAVAMVALLVLATTGVLAWPWMVRRTVVGQLAAATGRPVAVDTVELDVVRGRLAFRGLRVTDRDGGPLLSLGTAVVRFSLRDLLRGHARLTDVALTTLALRVIRTGPHEFNFSDLLTARAPGGAAPAVTLERLVVDGVVVVIEDRTLTPPRGWRAEGALHARNVSTVAGAPPGEATLDAVVGDAPVSLRVADVRLAPLQFRARLAAREIDASLAALYLPAGSPLSPAGGTASVSATIDHDPSTGTLVSLQAGLAAVALRRQGQESAYLAAPAVQVTVEGLRLGSGGVDLARLAVDGGAIFLEDTRLRPIRRWRIDGVALEARGLSSARDAAPGVVTARAATSGARAEVWGTRVRLAPLELHATAIIRNVDLALFRLYLPPELSVHPQRGAVNATVRVDHDERRGTRLDLDAGLGAIELQRPAHLVLAPSARVTAADIAFVDGAVTVGRATIIADGLTLEERMAVPKRTWVVKNLAIEAGQLSSRRGAAQGVASLRATVAGAAVSVWVTQARLDPLELRATTVLRNVDATLLQLYLPAEVPAELARGVVNATFEVDHTAIDGTRLTGDATFTGLLARGRGAFGTVTVTAPSARLAVADGRQRGQDLSVGRIELSGSGSVVDARGAVARFDFSQARIATEALTWPVRAPARVEVSLRFQDRGELDGTGTAQLTAPPPAVAWSADLALQFRRVDLAPLAVYVPAARGLGGRVRANVTAHVAYAGSLTARVRGDVGGARFALTDRGQPLLSLRAIEANGLDLTWPERMTIKRLRLRRPHALVERDRQGMFPLAGRLASPPSDAPSPPGDVSSPVPDAPRPALPAMAVEELIVAAGSAVVMDAAVTPSVRVDLPRVDLIAHNVTWPPSGPAELRLEAALPAGGTLTAEGTASAASAHVDLRLVLTDAALAPLQPYMGFRAKVVARVDANLTVAGPLSPSPRLQITGDTRFRKLEISDGQRTLLTTDRLHLTGIDATWPERITLGRLRARRSWALIERDERGGFLLRALLEQPAAVRPPGSPSPAPSGGPAAPAFAFVLREAILEEQAATIVDGLTTPPARIDVAGARLAVRDFSWPSRGAARVELTSPMPAGGRLDVAGTFEVEPTRVDVRAVLDGVAIQPVQPYLPIEGRITGKVTGDLAVQLALEPVHVQVAGQARLQAFRLSAGDRAVLTVGRVDTAGIEVDWPRRITVKSVQLRRPRLLIERDARGEIGLLQLVTPRRAGSAGPSPPGLTGSPAVAAASAPSTPPAVPDQSPVIEIETLGLERAVARFVDQTTMPAYSEELENVTVTLGPLTTAPGRRSRFTARGVLGGGSFKLSGEGTRADRTALDLKLELRDYILARANPYLGGLTAWTATSGTLSVTAEYALDGTRLDTRHDLLIRDLKVAPTDARDEVESRLGLPLGFLVSLLEDSRGEIRLSIPVRGDLSTREFDYSEAFWGALRNLTIRLLALPFSKVGSLFFSQDSKVEAVALTPVVFEAGTARAAPAMDSHLGRVAAFLRGAPAVRVTLEPILVDADIQTLRRERVLARLAPSVSSPGAAADALTAASGEFRGRWPERPVPPTLDAIVVELAAVEAVPPDATRDLATRRLEVVRQALTRGGVEGARLGGRARRTPLVEAAGAARVEFDLRPETASP